MSNLSIRKKSINTWLHTDSVFGDFIISKFYFNSFFAKFQIVEEGNARLEQYEIANITLYDDTDGGVAETFTTITELSLRLEELQYPAFDRTGTSVFPSMEQITNVNVTDVEDGQVLAWDVATSKWVNITIGGSTTPNFQEVLTEGSDATFGDYSLNLAVVDGSDVTGFSYNYDNGTVSNEVSMDSGAIFLQSSFDGKSANLAITEGADLLLQQSDGANRTDLTFENPTALTNIKIPAKADDGDYILATLDDLETGYIPLSGTPTDVYVTGALEYEPEAVEMFKWKDEEENYNDFFPFEQGFSFRNNNIEVFSFRKDGGLEGSIDASDIAPANKLYYAQRSYVDNELKPIVVSTSVTATLNRVHNVVATATLTDPTPTEGMGYPVNVINGTATIGGVGYTAGSLVYRFYQGGVWGSTSIGGTVPDASPTVKGIAKLYENLLASNTDGSVHQSALVTEFATKQTNFYKDASTSTAVTGTTANTILVSHLIEANTFAVGTTAEVRCNIQRVGANGNATYRMYTNTSNSLSGAVQLGTYTSTITAFYAPFKRLFAFKTGNVIFGSSSIGTFLNDEAVSSSAPSSNTFDPTVDNYIIIAVQPNSASDSFTSELFTIKGNK